MDKVIADSGIDAVIYRVSRKADISEQAATIAVDEVLTAVKDRLPPAMAAKLVNVIAGEERFGGWRSIGDKLRSATKTGTVPTQETMAAMAQRVTIGVAQCAQITKRFAIQTAAKLSAMWTRIRPPTGVDSDNSRRDD